MGPLRSGHWEEISYVKDFSFEIVFEGKWGESFWMLRQLSDLGAAAAPVEGGGRGNAGRKRFMLWHNSKKRLARLMGHPFF